MYICIYVYMYIYNTSVFSFLSDERRCNSCIASPRTPFLIRKSTLASVANEGARLTNRGVKYEKFRGVKYEKFRGVKYEKFRGVKYEKFRGVKYEKRH